MLANIARFGAWVGYEGPHLRIRSHNHSSVHRISDIITQNIMEELTAGRIAHVSSLPSAFFISSLGAIEKKTNGQLTGWRRIHDLSFPHGSSVNDGILEHYGSLQYQTLDDAIKSIASAGRYSILRKRDLKDAFRMIPISPYDYWLFLFEWNNALYVDIFLPFGLRTSPYPFWILFEGTKIGSKIAKEFWIWIIDEKKIIEIVNKLSVENMFKNPAKTFSEKVEYVDGYRVDFLGIELDTELMQARFPPDKHARALTSVLSLL